MSGPVVFALRLLLTVSLYVFLAWAFISLWRDIRLQGALLSNRKVPPISLSLNNHGSDPETRHFNQAEVTIGRNPACECRVKDDALSGRHARLSFHHNQWWLEDLGSTNGTLLNQERLTTPTVIISGDELQCGNTYLTIAISDCTPTGPDKKIP